MNVPLLFLFAAVSFQSAIEQVARETPGRLGVAAMVIETGERFSFHGGERYPMQSVYKLPIAMAVLSKVDAGLPIDEKIRVEQSDYVRPGQHSPIRGRYPQGKVELPLWELLRYAVAESDGSASDVLLRIAGGSDGVMQYLHRIGVRGIQVSNSEKEIGAKHEVQYRNSASPLSAVSLLSALQSGQGLSGPSQALLLEMMTSTPTGPRRIKCSLGAGVIVAHKTGSSGTVDGVTAATNDIGIVTLPSGRHLAIAVFLTDSSAPEEVRESAIARSAEIIYRSWKQK